MSKLNLLIGGLLDLIGALFLIVIVIILLVVIASIIYGCYDLIKKNRDKKS